MENWEKKEAARLQKLRTGKQKADGSDEQPAPSPPPPSMLPDEVDNFLKLATLLKMLMACTVTLVDLIQARGLLDEYLKGYVKVCA